MTTAAAPGRWRAPPLIANPWLRRLLIAGAALYLVAALATLEVNWQRLAEGVPRALRFVAAFFPPDFASRWSDISAGLVESLTMTLTSTVVGIAISVPIGVGAARNVAPPWLYLACRAIIAASRSFQEIIVAILLVALVGFGPLAGFLTLSFATIGFLAKLLAEDIEDVDPAAVEAVKATGASFLQWLNYGIQPQVMPRLIGLSLYRLDINFRESAVIGIVGAGGIGATLNTAIDRYEFDSAAAILLIIIAIVMLAEYFLELDPAARAVMAGSAPATWRRRTPGAQLARFAGWLALVAFTLYCFRVMTADTMWVFLLDAHTQAADLGARMFPPRWSYIHELWYALWETLNIATLGTLLAIALAVPVAFLAARNTTPSVALVRPVALFVIVASRSINSLIWALLLVAIIGPGALAGIVAIALRSIGFIAKLLYEAIEEIDATQVEAVTAAGASPAQVLVYAVWPQILPAFAGISVFRWDINIRESTVLGLVGAGGIGLQLQASLNVLAWPQVTLIFLVILLTVLVSEWVSARVRHAFI